MRIFYATDLHGSEVCFRKFINAGKFYGADTLICGGDITGKMLVPIIRQKDGSYEATYYDQKVVAKNDEELQSLIKTIRNIGFYYVVTDTEEFSTFDREKVDRTFKKAMMETLRQWLALAEERLKPAGIQCYMMPGNDDIFEVDDLLSNSDYVHFADGKVLKVGSFEMVTLGYANVTPWHCVRDIPEEEFAKKIDRLAEQVEHMDRCIFNIHCHPFDTGLDSAPELDENFKPKLEGGELKQKSAGSTAVRRAIEKYQPMLGLHGHIHESKGVTRLGKTVLINPGSEYQQSVLRGAVLDISERRKKIKWTLTAG
ncbi:MAG: metallophosphoesterase [Oscillospiraceae bacterium]|jgi:Icc-related predicted phosphoesterase|nr:metallophosphoesterase [Oscillospiraceae bacterium]MCI1990836.1 metallophosphoesterase [Oscillospiraceae bacterium]